jgi:hypothetical protein
MPPLPFKFPFQGPRRYSALKVYLRMVWGITLPDTKICEKHSTPFRAFAEAYFADSPCCVWKASRGLGGKSFLMALLGTVEASTLGAAVNVLGGSGEQSQRVIEAQSQFW